MMERRRALDGSLPRRISRNRRPLTLPADGAYTELLGGSGNQAASTTMAFTRLIRNLTRDEQAGSRIVPIIPDEARTFGMDALFREIKIYAAKGQKYEPVDHDLLLSYTEASDGQILEEGITEAGSTASWIAAGTSYATRGVPVIPFYIFYSMFGFQRVGDLIWQAADARTRGFLLGATAGRTTLLGEGLQHQDGHSLVLASTVPPCQAYDPAFAYEMAAIVKHGIRRMYGPSPEDVFYYLTLYNENHPMPADARPRRHRGRDRAGPVPLGRRPRRGRRSGPRSCSRVRPTSPPARRRPTGRALRRRRRAVVGHVVQVAARRGPRRRAVEPAAPGRVGPHAARHAAAGRRRRARRGRHRLHEDRARAGRPVRPRPPVHPARHRRVRPLATPARRCGASSRSTPPTWWWPCSRRWPSRAR